MKRIPAAHALSLVLSSAIGTACVEAGEPSVAGRLPRVAGDSYPWLVESSRGALTIESPPRRVVPGNAAWVDIVTLLVEQDRVRALPEDASVYSRLAGADDGWSAVPRFRGLAAETLLALEPDLVLLHDWQGSEVVEVLHSEGIAVLSVPDPETWHECLELLDFLGAVLDVRERARETRVRFEERAAALARRVRRERTLRALSYTNLGAGGWAAGKKTSADVLFALAGLQNAAAAAGIVGHSSVDLGRLIALDPDLVVVGLPAEPGRAPPSASYLLSEPELAELTAVREKRIVALPARLFTTTSLELLTGAELLADEVERLFPAR